jgi:hypothetical protein
VVQSLDRHVPSLARAVRDGTGRPVRTHHSLFIPQ